MASIGDIVTRYHAALTSCANGADSLRDAEQYLTDCLNTLTAALAGASDDEPIRLLALALTAIGEARDAVHAAADGIQQEASRLNPGVAGSTTTRGTPQATPSPAQPSAVTGTASTAGHPAQPPVSRTDPTASRRATAPVVRGSGQKTHGRWIAPDDTAQTLISGKDEYDRPGQ